MATPKALEALKKTKEALVGIKERLQPVIQRLNDDAFEETTSQAQATVALSVGMMRYMGARLRGLDQGRKPGDPLRKELDNMRKVLAEIKKRAAEKKKPRSHGTASPPKSPAKQNQINQKTNKQGGSTDQEMKQKSIQSSDGTKKRKSAGSGKSAKKRKSS